MSKKKTALPNDIDSIFNKSAFFDEGDTSEDNQGSKQEDRQTKDKQETKLKQVSKNGNKIIETERANGTNERSKERVTSSGEQVSEDEILQAIKSGKVDDVERTERYSFEIYPSQKERIEDFLYQYKKRTGQKLSASKLIRTAVDEYLDKVFNQLQ